MVFARPVVRTEALKLSGPSGAVPRRRMIFLHGDIWLGHLLM